MQNVNRARHWAACIALTALVALPAHAELVTNGGFEVDGLPDGGGMLRLQTIPTGWNNVSTNQNVDLIGDGYFGGTASEGTKFLDLIGNSTGSFPSGVRQSLFLQGGVTYRLSFDYNGGAPLDVVDPLLQWALGSLDSGSINVGSLNVFAGNGRPVTAWSSFTRDITAAASGDYWLSFSTPYGNSGGPYLDNVSLTALPPGPVVDEPAALALVIGALGLLAITRRRSIRPAA